MEKKMEDEMETGEQSSPLVTHRDMKSIRAFQIPGPNTPNCYGNRKSRLANMM